METELKLKIAQADLPCLRDHPLLRDAAEGAPVDHEFRDTYFDTTNLDLWHAGVTLRVRANGDTWIQTVKTAVPGDSALHERGKWESTLEGPEPAPDALVGKVKNKTVAGLLRDTNITNELRPVFHNTTRRTVWQITLSDGTQVECALDAGQLHAGGRNAPIGELELELKQGDPASLFTFAQALHADTPFELANDSKAARGYALLDAGPPTSIKAAPVSLSRKMRLEDALQCMGLNCLQQLESNVPGVLQQSVESLHQMRVGLRRLRALLNMFDDLAPLPIPIRESVEWLSGELGATRDWDVLASSTIPAIKGIDLGQLRSIAEQRARSLHGDLLKTLRDPRYTQLILQLNGWFYGRQWRQDGTLPQDSAMAKRSRDAMTPLLRKAQRRLRKRINILTDGDATQRHRVRIAAKKARYAAEFFRDLLPAKRVKRYVHTLSGLQDLLGHLNDLTVADRLLGEVAATKPSSEITYARGYITGVTETEGQHLHRALSAVEELKTT